MPIDKRTTSASKKKPKTSSKPTIYTNLRGTFDNPIVINGKGTVSLNLYNEDPANAAGRVAYLRQENGFFPSVGQISDQAAVVLHGCQYVVLRGFDFDECWPAALYLNDCQHIAILDCSFGTCTQAIGANGVDTRDIWIERCSFHQTKKHFLWNTIEWNQVHGSFENAAKGGVNTEDYRHLDGDFFRAWNIAGNVTIRDCDINDAFNGIHFFNSVDDLPVETNRSGVRFNNGRRSSVNVLIENNRFTNVRDNCIEPEDHAWNWVVRSNTFKDCLAPYSFELKRAGWFYIYDNHHWFEKLKEEIKGERKSASGFKFGGSQVNEGDFYIFNNSWLSHQGERLLRQRVLGRMKHFNNCIKMTNGQRRLFGSEWSTPDKDKAIDGIMIAEKRRFTRRWADFKIEMDGDWIYERDGMDWRDYAIAGYPLGFNTESHEDPEYEKFTSTPKNIAVKQWLKPSIKMQKSGKGWTMRLPGYDESGEGNGKFQGRYELQIPKKSGVGAGLSKVQLNYIDQALRFIPDHPLKFPPPIKGRKQLPRRPRQTLPKPPVSGN